MDCFDDFDDFDDENDADSEMDDLFDCDSECDAETNQAESQGDDFTSKGAFFLGSAIGFGYEEGLRSRRRKKRNRFVDDDSD